jgi:two-component system, NtrC family, sensor kinase
MKIGRLFPDLLTPLGAAASIEDGLTLTLKRLLALTDAVAGALAFRPPSDEPAADGLRRSRRRPPGGAGENPIVVTAGARPVPRSVRAWLATKAVTPSPGLRVATVTPPDGPRGGRWRILSAPLGAPHEGLGQLVLLGRARRLTRTMLPGAFPRELGSAIAQVWRLHQRTLRITVLNEITALLVSSGSVDEVLRGFAEGLGRLVRFDSITLALVDAERAEIEITDVLGRITPGAPARDTRVPLAQTLLADMLAKGQPVTADDLSSPTVPAASRASFSARGYRSAMLVPLISHGGAIGAVTLASHRAAAFTPADVDVVAELARPLASAVEQRRLLAESHRRAEELAALYQTGQLITARLDVPSVLDRISRAVSALIGSTGCGIGLLDADGKLLTHAAAHGFNTAEWRRLSIPVGEGIIGMAAATGQPVRVDDVPTDPRSARRDIDEREGLRSLLCVPLKVGDAIIGVISAFSTRPSAFTAHHQRVLEAFADQAGIAIGNAQLVEESVRRARETRALLEAGRAVSASLGVEETMRVIMTEVRNVLGVASCGIFTIDPESQELVNVASLDLAPQMVGTIRLRLGEGLTGLAVAERRPVQSRDLFADPRGGDRFLELRRQTAFRSMLAVPLREADRATGALIVLRKDMHEFTPAEQELLVALADQAAIALEHARLYERLEGMVAERTRELDAQRRFVEVVLETLPLGVFVLDADLSVMRVNREGGRVLAARAAAGAPFADLLGDRAASVVESIRDACEARRVGRIEEELTVAGEPRVLRLTVAPLEPVADAGTRAAVLVEDVTLAKRLERQMLLTERLTTAGRLASGVAHELNNPLATIAGCAEALQSRLREGGLAAREEFADFPRYLALIEEEAYRCKEITGSLLQFVREPGSRRAPTDLNALVQKSLELLSHQSRFAESRLLVELDPALPEVVVNEGQIRQVLLGIAANALEAMDGRGTFTIRTRAVRDEVEIEFEDEGPGIADDVLPRIFDPFFTTKPPGQGTGLGLAIAQGIVADHGGRIEVTSRPEKGSLFRVVLPR